MQYPLISEYIDAISMAEDNLDELSHLVPVLDKKGKPVMSGGNFAVVFKMQDSTTGKYYALKCFTREQDTRQEDYIKIAKELSYVSSPYIVGVRYLPKELFVDTTQSNEEEFPVLLMDWVEGQTLDNYLRSNINNPAAIRKLSSAFNRMAIWLLTQPFAHGDLKPDNIIVNSSGELVLVDYDGMYVPSMKGKKSKETGSPNFRHPQRSDEWFDETIDDFSLSLMATALYALTLQPDLLQQYEAKDAILFTEKDLLNLPQSKLYSSLSALLYDKTFAKLFSLLQLSFARVAIRGQYATMFAQDEANQEAYKSLYDKAMKLYQTSDDKTEAYRLLSQAAEQIEIIPQNDTYQSIDTKQEPEQKHKQRNSIREISRALSFLEQGNKYYFGRGVEQDYVKAVEYWREAAEQGNAAAQCNLGYCYDCGQGVEQDYKKAVEWYKKSAEQGYAAAQCKLGYCYQYGQGVEQDYKKAVECYKKSAEQGNAVAQKNLGYCYKYGQGVEQDYGKAVEWYKKSAEQGDASAQFSLGYCYQYGQGVERDYTKAVEWYKKSAEQGDAVAQNNLGVCYECGRGVDKDYRKAVEWYERAAKQGNEEAKESLDKLLNPNITFEELIEAITYEHGVKYTKGGLKLIDVPKNLETYTIKDEHGVKYTKDGLKLIDVPENLETYTIKEGTKVIANSAFWKCRSLQTIDIPNSVTKIGRGAFGGCSSLQTIELPDSVTRIGAGSFEDCSSLQSIIIPDSVTEIGESVFRGCKALQSIVIPQNVTKIGYGVFAGCNNLTITCESPSFYLKEGLLYSKEGVLIYCFPTTKDIVIPKDVTKIGDWAFYGCNLLQSIEIPDSVTKMGNRAFSSCTSLQSIEIPNSVTEIGECAFDGCSSLQSVVIPNSVTKIGNSAFKGCIYLQSIEIPDSVTEIGWGTFEGCSSLQTIEIPNSITKIGNSAFSSCSSLQSIVIPNSVTEIGIGVFSGCSSLQSVVIPNRVTKIGESVFEDCSSLQSVKIPDSVIEIDERAFEGCTSLKSVVVSRKTKINKVDDSTFKRTTKIRKRWW